MASLLHLSRELAELEEQQLLRRPLADSARTACENAARRLGRPFVDLCSNDYLGLGREPLELGTVTPGAGASRLVYGTHELQERLEAELAATVAAPAALLFASGFTANAGLLPALTSSEDLILSDALNHASTIDGARLSKARVVPVPHLDVDALRDNLSRAQARQVWVVLEGYYSMDGDSPDLRAVMDLCEAYGAALYLDEAHSWGLFGPGGAGLARQAEITPDVHVLTFGKSLGCQGGAAVTSEMLRTYLWNRCRSFLFSTGLSPAVAALTLAQLARLRRANDRRHSVLAIAEKLRQALHTAGLRLPQGSHGPIIPVILGENERALHAAQWLRDRGILAQAIRPPTVPPGTARLRLTVSSCVTEEHLTWLIPEILSACAESSS